MTSVYRGFFTEEECDKIYLDVMSSENKWIKWSKSGVDNYGNSFFRRMLATPDHQKDRTNTYKNYREVGMFRHSVHDLFKEKLLKMFNKVEYPLELSGPGFNIVTENPARSWHFDDEKFYYPYSDVFPDFTTFADYFDRVLTFTIMITAGNFTYDYFKETTTRYIEPNQSPCLNHIMLNGDNCSNPNCQLKHFDTVEYKKGDLLLGEDRFLHRVGFSNFTEGQPRITLQSQCVIKDDVLYLYW